MLTAGSEDPLREESELVDDCNTVWISMSYLLCVINTNGAGEVFIQWFKEGQRILQLIWVRDFKFDLITKVIDATQIEQSIEGFLRFVVENTSELKVHFQSCHFSILSEYEVRDSTV